jgi:L-lactate utilization protein LutC
MKGDARSIFLDRVRHAAAKGRAYRVHLHDVPEGTGYVGARSEDLCAAMAAEITEVGGHAHVVADIAAANTLVRELVQQYAAKRVLLWRHELLARLRLEESLRELGVGQLDYDVLATLDPAARRSALMAADVGITSCDLAIAETGSLLVCSRAGQERVASLVTPVHIAIVERQQIVPDLFDAFARLGEAAALSSNVVLITGPSKTGDIELTLTTGVHGPGVWHVVIVQSSAGSLNADL